MHNISKRLYFKTAKLNQSEKVIDITFPYSPQYVNEIKSIPGKKFHKKEKKWTVCLCLQNCFALKNLNYQFSKELKDWANAAYLRNHKKYSLIDLPGVNGTLKEYQNIGVQKIENFEGRCLLADEMGLGKTLQALAWTTLHPEFTKILIICPASLKYNWAIEIRKWLNKGSQILAGRKPYTFSTGFVIINYDIVDDWKAVLKAHKFDVMILDEAHYIKSSGTVKNPIKRTMACLNLANHIPKIITITGTPIENKTFEIWNCIKIVNPHLFANEYYFKYRYCAPKNNGFGMTFDGASNSEELHELLINECMIRRLKKDVEKELPDKTYIPIHFEIDNKKEYEQAEEQFITWLSNSITNTAKQELDEMKSLYNNDLIKVDEERLQDTIDEKIEKSSALTQLTVLKQLAVKGKINACIEWIENWLEENPGEKLLIFTYHTFVIDLLEKKFNKISVKIDGSVSISKRHSIVESFQNDKKIKIFLGQIKAAGVGLTLTAARTVLFIEYPWTPGTLNQAIDRTHRIGQTQKVFVYFSVALKTIEERIVQLILDKQNQADSVIDGGKQENSSMLENVVNSYRE